MISALTIGIPQVTAGTLSAIGLVVCVLTPLSAFESTARLPMAAVQYVRSAAAARRIMTILDSAQLDLRQVQVSPAPVSDGLRTSDLEIGWPGDGPIAKLGNLWIERGNSLAIVGKSGIGKSTLLYTLAGMLPPKSGSVMIDGVEVSTIKRSAIRDVVALTAEDAHLFETSILENLRVARGDVSETEAIRLLEAAGLGSWLTELPDGVHTIIGADAKSVSGGERRRLLLARALATNADFLLLDEPGEHLDSATADALIRDLLALSDTGRGIVLVTHRLSPLDAADNVIVLDSAGSQPAEVAAHATHHELLENQAEYAWSVAQEDE